MTHPRIRTSVFSGPKEKAPQDGHPREHTYHPPHQPRQTGVSSCILYHKKARVSTSIRPDWELIQPRSLLQRLKNGPCIKKRRPEWPISSTGSESTAELTGCEHVRPKSYIVYARVAEGSMSFMPIFAVIGFALCAIGGCP